MFSSDAQETVAKAVDSGPKCGYCKENVFTVEKVQAIEQVWHRTCFVCGGVGDLGCKKVLTLDNYLNHGNDPYCKSCHNKLFGLKGYGYGSIGAVLNSYPDPENEAKLAAVANTESQSTTSIMKQPSKAMKFGEAPKCTVCSKSVFMAEKLQAVDRVWHKLCFTCGGTGSDGGCQKVLTLDSYLTHGVDPFCKTCHGKLFGPKGFGFGLSAAALNSYPTEAQN